MTLKTSLAISLLTVAAILSVNADAASNALATPSAEKSETKAAPQSQQQSEGATNVVASGKETKPEQTAVAKVNPMFDKSRHFHPRDGGKL